ncbi:MAG: hypothetical protein SFV32_12910 [Opitutaceae bacterium]|nr:hypothetical protein [Opitutaceae bacterium]
MHSTRSYVLSRPFFLLGLGALLALGTNRALATEYVFSDPSGYLSYAGSPTGTTTFDGIALDPDGSAYLASGYTEGATTFSILDAGIESLFAFSPSYYATSAFTSTYLNNNGGFNGQGFLDIEVSFSKAIHSFSLDLAPLINATGDLRTWFTFATGSVEWTNPGALLDDPSTKTSFFGYYSDTPFSSFTIRDYSGALAMDSLSYSDKIARDPNAVPDTSSTLAMAAVALATLTRWASRQRRNQMDV